MRLAWGNCLKISGLTMQNQLSVFCFTLYCKKPADFFSFLLKIYWELPNRGVSNGNVSFFFLFFFSNNGAVYTLMQ